MISIAAKAAEQVPQSGGQEMSQPQGKIEPQWKAVGVVYAKTVDGVTEFVILYEAHIEIAVKAEIAERFGVGSKEWKP